MKNIFKSFLMLLSGAMLFASCLEEAAPLASAISVDKQELTFAGASAEAQKVKVKADGDWFVISSEDWVTVTPSNGNGDTEVTIKVADNVDSYSELNGPRSTVVNFCYGTAGITPVTVKQLGEAGLDASRTYSLITKQEDIVAGSYLIVFKNGSNYIAMEPLAASKNYGYLNAVEVTPEDGVITMANASYAFTLEAAETGFNMIMPDNRYVFMTGGYTSFNASAALADSNPWTLTLNEDGTVNVAAVTHGHYIQYSTGYSSAGAYTSPQDGGLLPYLYKDSKAKSDEVLSVKDAIVPAFATEAAIKVTSNKKWTVRNHDSWVKSFTTSGEGNGTITVTFDEYTNATEDRTARFQVIGEGTNMWITLTQSKVAAEMTVAEFLAAEKGEYAFLTGKVGAIAKAEYGNFDLVDATGTVYVYGLYDLKGNKVFIPLGLKEDDEITLYGKKDVYKDTPQVAGAIYISHVASKYKRNLAFSAASAEATIGNEFTAPVLSGETAGVVYSSSNTKVATVNSSTGAVTLVGEGSTTITASAPETETHLAGTASYTLTVSSKQTRALAFSAETAEAKVGEAFTAPTLSGETTGVVYSSSNTSVATVDSATGAVTVIAAGQTTITASAPETQTHLAGTASYTLTVAPAASSANTIASVLALGQGATIPANTVVEGVVISNMDLNNLTSKKGMYIQDETAGLQFYLAANHTFKFGDKVKVDLSGAKIAAYNGAVQISGLALNKITVVSSGNAVQAKTVTIEDFLANKYEGQYVAIEGVQVADADLSKKFVTGGAHTSINIENAAGKKFVVFSSKYATYGAETVPQGSGVIKGISSINNGTLQLIFAQNSDYAGMTGARFGEGGGQTPDPEPEQPETPVDGNRADFETISEYFGQYTKEFTTAAGWHTVNCAIQEGYTSDINPQFICIGKVPGTDTWAKAVCINGKTSASGVLESPEIAGGCGTLSFNYGNMFSESNGVSFKVEVIQNGSVVKTLNFTKDKASVPQKTKLEGSLEVNVSGSFKLKFTNNCPSNNSSSNKDRVSIWNLTWTSRN